MKRWKLTTVVSLVILIAALAAPGLRRTDHAAADAPAPWTEQLDRESIVRVYYPNRNIGNKIIISFESALLETNYEQGYHVMQVTPEERALLAQAGLRIEADTTWEPPKVWPLSAVIDSIPGYSCYRTVEETFATAEDIVNDYLSLATWTDAGNSWEKSAGLGGYDMLVLKLTNSNIAGPKPKLFVTSGLHAREYATAELMTRFAEYLVDNYGTDADATWILDYHEVHLMLHANPDGRKKAETGLSWRKNTNQNYCSPTSNYRGADLNRNFDFQWGCCGGSSGSECSETYRGPFAASEPETQAVQNYLLAQFPDQRGPNLSDPAPDDATGIYLDIHSYGELVIWPWGFTSTAPPNSTQLRTLGRKFAYWNGHEPDQAIGLYVTDGTTDDFSYGELGIASYCFELGTAFFQSCSTFENTIYPGNLPSLIYAAKVVRTPYMTPAGPDSYNLSLSSDPVAAGTPVTLSGTVNDTRYNNSNGTEPTQNIAAAEYYVDTPPWESGATAHAMSASDGSFNTTSEGVQASVDTTGWSLGQHIIFVRGQDANGNWGAISAIFLTIDDGATPTPTPSSTMTLTPSPTPTMTPTPLPGILFSDDFETDQGWTEDPSGTDTATTGLWERANPEETSYSGVIYQLGTTHSGSYDLVTEGTAGSSVGSYDIDGGLTSIRSPNIALPSGETISLEFYYYLAHYTNGATDDFLRVRVVGSTTTTVLEELGAANSDAAVWDYFETDISSYAGQTVYLLIEAADGGAGSLIEAGIDDVVVRSSGVAPTNTPLPPTDTPLPPTDTPIPPTDTPLPPTDTPGPGPVFWDDFETSQGWTEDPSGTDTATTGMWERANPEETSYSGVIYQLGTTYSGSYDLVTEGTAGSSVGSYDIDGGLTSIRSPDITLPGSGDVTLSFRYYLAHYTNGASDDFLRVKVVGSTTTTVFEELGAANTDAAAWDYFEADISAYAGQTIYLLIEAADGGSGSLIEAAIDDVLIE